jgi:type IV pilus assembly protein PilQ
MKTMARILLGTAILLTFDNINFAQSKIPPAPYIGYVGQSVNMDSSKVGTDSPVRTDSLGKMRNARQDSPLNLKDTVKAKQGVVHLPPGANDTTTLSFKDADIRDIFRALAYQHGLNIFVDNSINRRTTISLNRVRVYDAIRFLCEQNSLNLVLDGGIFKISEIVTPKVISPPHVPYVAYSSGRLWIDAKNDDLPTVVQEIEKKSSKNILIMTGTSGAISGTLNDIDFDIGFTQLLNNNGFAVQKKDGVYLVSLLNYFVGNGQQGKTSGPYWISVKDSLVTIDVSSAPVARVISDVIHQTNADVIFYDDVPGSITARVTDVSLTDALNLLLANTKSTYRISDGKYFIGDKADRTMTETRLFELKYMRPDRIVEMTPQSISSQAVIKPVKEHNGVVLMSTRDVISQFEDFIKAVDKPVPQVLIEAIVVDYDLTKSSSIGVNAGIQNAADTSAKNYTVFPGINYTSNGTSINATLKQTGNINLFGTSIGVANLGVLPTNFYLNLQALEQKGVADVRSRPLLATLNGYPASLSIGTTQYYELNTTIPYNGQGNQTVFQTTQNFQTIQADVKLEITPYVGADGMIFVDIKPDFKTPEGTFSSSVPPTIDERAMSSTLEMREGETIVLGGMISNTTSVNKTATPFLGDIPILGELFSYTTRSNEKRELIIYITPHISYGREFENVYLPGQEK